MKKIAEETLPILKELGFNAKQRYHIFLYLAYKKSSLETVPFLDTRYSAEQMGLIFDAIYYKLKYEPLLNPNLGLEEMEKYYDKEFSKSISIFSKFYGY